MYSMKKLTDRRLAVLNFIRERANEQGVPPTLAEIAAACGLVSRSSAQKHVKALEADGLIGVTAGQARGVRAIERRPRDGATKNPLFEVNSSDVESLDDEALRELVARMLIARFSSSGHPAQYVRWGGDQRAKDGGIDVSVEAPASVARDLALPSGRIGIQVKATSMPPKQVQREMCPQGVLRPFIRQLLSTKGAYFIMCSESVSEQMYKARVDAMKEAAAQADQPETLVDFFDARRIADWVNEHPSVVAWLRHKVGRPLQGWKPFGTWTQGDDSGALIDDRKERIFEHESAYPLTEGLTRVREVLHNGGASVRLAGLSGVGKTRFAQALFEGSLSDDPLESSLAIYADISDDPEPSPQHLMDELVSNRRHAIVVIDNCSSDTHRQLTAKCKSSTVSLLTIEYDIRDDLPEETDVFRMEPASEELVDELLKRRFPDVSQVNVDTIKRIADGNSRVAIALANSLNKRDSLAALRDEELFRRLFWQKNEQSQSLLHAAQAASLVYSFDGESEVTELPRIAALAGLGVLETYREVANLMARGLAQRRGVWRAVLPHAIANTLAKQALEGTPYSRIARELVDGGGRLLRSFSRRLGYLHDSPAAVSIVRQWLSDGGILCDLATLDSDLYQVLLNVAPVDPESVLLAIERAAEGPNSARFLSVENARRATVARVVRSIAYDRENFDRCMAVLTKFAIVEPPEHKSDRTSELIKSLFPMYLSGTHATKEQRAGWISKSIRSQDETLRMLAVDCLDSAMEAHNFSSYYGFDFGVRPRDYGLSPRSRTEAHEWFKPFIDLAIEIATSKSSVADQVRNVLARNFRSLWSLAHQYDLLEEVVRSMDGVHTETFWLAIRQTLAYDKPGMPEAGLKRLLELEELSRPKTLESKIRAVVLTSFGSGFDVTDGDEDEDVNKPHERADRDAFRLGRLASADLALLQRMLPELMENRQGRHWRFGHGLAEGANSFVVVWGMLVESFEERPAENRNVQVLNGYLFGVHEKNPVEFNNLMNQAMSNASLAQWVPLFQAGVGIDSEGFDRLLRCLDMEIAPANAYQYLGYGRASNDLTEDQLVDILSRVASIADGNLVALDVLSLHRYGESFEFGPRLIEFGRRLLLDLSRSKHTDHTDFHVKRLMLKCLNGPEGEPAAREILKAIRHGLEEFTLSPYDIDDEIDALFEVQPIAALDILVGQEDDEGVAFMRRRDLEKIDGSHPMSKIPAHLLTEWASKNPSRWIALAASIPALKQNSPDDGQANWSEKAISLVQAAPSPWSVAEVLLDRIYPRSWMGSRARILQARLNLFEEILRLLPSADEQRLEDKRAYFLKVIDRERRRESEEDRQQNERFE